jgi:hypothetical protein
MSRPSGHAVSRRFTVTRAALGILVALSIVNAADQAVAHIGAPTRVEMVFGALKIVVGVLAGIALWRMVTAPRTALAWLVAWAMVAAVLAGMAPVVFGGAPIKTGLLSFGASALLLAACLLWWRAVTRTNPSGL